MGVTAHGVTHPGPRASNEDAFLIDMTGGVFVVADGMGGHNAGEVAAGLAVEAIRTFVSARTSPRRQPGRRRPRGQSQHPGTPRPGGPSAPAWARRSAAALVT
jgi:hypothetical protein